MNERQDVVSNYSNYVQGFPKRCAELLKSHYDSAAAGKQEVTLMLSIGSAGLIIPFERLEPPKTDKEGRPISLQGID